MTLPVDPQPSGPVPQDEARAFDLLECPEAWPEDPGAQRELADLLELHLALSCHGAELAPALAPPPRPRWTASWALAAAAVLLVALVPAGVALHRQQTLRAQAQDTARLDALARKRNLDRAWIAFFQQSTSLIKDFQQRPELCLKGEEDRREEREMAVGLLEISHQLAAQGAPTQEAEAIRSTLHAWLSEVAFEADCLDARRAQELRQWAASRNLGGQAGRMERLLRGDGA